MNRRQRQRQRQEEERRWNPPQLVHRDNNRRGVLYPKSPMTIFFVFLFLLSVRMSVSNIRQAVELLPDSNTYDRYLTPLATFPISDRPNELPSSNISGSTKDSLSAQASNLSLPPLLSVIPNANNTAISLVSMGNLVGTFLVERCIRSIRRRGKFTGVIMVFTDSVGYKQYQETIPSWDDRTVIIQGREEDMHPREENSDRVVRLNQLVGKNHTEPQLKIYKQDTMVFKRFKTHHSKYIADNPALSDSIRYVMYLDIDNIIGSKLDTFFEGYTKMVIDQYQQATDSHRNATSAGRDGIVKLADESNASGDDGFGFVSMFRDKHLKSKLHRYVRYTAFMLFSLLFSVLFCPLCSEIIRILIHADNCIVCAVVSSFSTLPSKSDA